MFTPALKLRFLDELARHGNVKVAAARVGVSRSGLYLARRRDAAFAQGWRAGLVLARDHAEAVLAERALDGVEEPVFFRGELIAVRRRFDTRLLLAHLARLDQLCAAEAEAAVQAAGFDAALARIAGLAEHRDGARRDLDSGEPIPWPTRAEHVAEAAELAGSRYDCGWYDEDEEEDELEEAGAFYDDGDQPDEDDDEEEDEHGDEEDEAPEARREACIAAAEHAAAAEWDAYHARLWAAVDGIVLGASSAGSAAPPAGRASSPEPCPQCPPRGNGPPPGAAAIDLPTPG